MSSGLSRLPSDLMGAGDFVSPYLKTIQHVRAIRCGDCHVRGVAAAGNQDASNSRLIVAWIKAVPVVAEKDLHRPCKIHRRINRRHAYIPQVGGAIAGGDIEAATKRDRQVRIVATNALALIESLPGSLRRTGVLIAECNVLMDIVTDGLNPPPAERSVSEEFPGDVGKQVAPQ
jgi:hypothetical protein